MLWVYALVTAALIVLVAILYHNRFVVLSNRCNEAWANVDTELRRRHDLVPNLVVATRGYAKHERGLLTEVVKARTEARGADRHAAARAEKRLVVAVDRLLAVAEAYPELKSDAAFRRLQEELAITEDRIQAARRFYNGNVRAYRDATRQFPGSVFASLYGAPPQEFFQIESLHMRSAVRV